MKNKFIEKIDELNKEISSQKSEFRKKIYYLEEELTQTKEVKDLFLKQITELQKRNN